MMSKTKKIVFIGIALLFPFYSSLAQQLGSIPGQESLSETSSLTDYLEGLYNFGISITGILAIFMIAVGAFSYIVTSAGNSSKMMDAKEKITNALIGLVIALTAYLLLYVINPDLVGGTLEGPEKAINDAQTSTQTKNNSTGFVPIGTECNDGSANPICTGCPLCANCIGGYHLDNASGKHICGQSPSKTAPSNAIGCCVSDLNKKCSPSITKTDCEAKLGGSFHTSLSGSFKCKDTVKWGKFYICDYVGSGGGNNSGGTSDVKTVAKHISENMPLNTTGCCETPSTSPIGSSGNSCNPNYTLTECEIKEGESAMFAKGGSCLNNTTCQ